jgi:signal transduction histidine kinase
MVLVAETQVSNISAHMAHEIRNPLIAAGGFARRLRDSLPKDDAKGRLAQIIVDIEGLFFRRKLSTGYSG